MAKFAKYYLRFTGDFGPYDWDNRQGHLASLFAEDNSISFGEGKPSEEQLQKGIPYAKTYKHRIYHLECNPNIIVMQFANSIDTPMEINYEMSIVKNEPSCFVIIDNRDGMRTVAIQNRRKAFSAPKKVADIMTKRINEELYSKYCYQTEILPEYYPEDLLKAWNEMERITQAIKFCPPEGLNTDDIMRNWEGMKDEKKPYFGDSLMLSMLQLYAASKEANYLQAYEVRRGGNNARIPVDINSKLMKNMLTFSRAANTPVELLTTDGVTYRCFVDSDEDNTDKIVHAKLESALLEKLFERRKRDVEKEEIAKAESEIVQMLNGMKHTSEDIESNSKTA